MSTVAPPPTRKKHTPYVPETMEMKEFTLRALLIGLVMTAILGSANAYLGLKAGMTIAATYPAAVIGMALLRLMKGSLLEENIARTVGSIGESVAAGAVFTIPAFVMAGLWPGLTRDKYWTSVALMVIGGTLGILFVTLLRRVMVEDPDLPFPESVAASEIHKAGQQGLQGGQDSFRQYGLWRIDVPAGRGERFFGEQHVSRQHQRAGQEIAAAHQHESQRCHHGDRGRDNFHRAGREPGLPGSRLHHRPAAGVVEFCRRRAGLGTARSAANLRPWPTIQAAQPAGQPLLVAAAGRAIYFSVVRPIAVGGMLVGASYTLFKMRKQLGAGMARAVSDLKKSAAAHAASNRTDRDLSAKVVFAGVGVVFLAMIALYYFFIGGAGNLSSSKVITASRWWRHW